MHDSKPSQYISDDDVITALLHELTARHNIFSSYYIYTYDLYQLFVYKKNKPDAIVAE